MSRSPRRRYHLIPLVYAAVILGLFALALFGRGFSRSVGEARVSGRYTPLPLLGRTEVRSAALSYNGLTLRFSRGEPLHSGGAGGASQDLALRSVQVTGAAVEIFFGRDTRLTVAAAKDGSLSLSLAGPPGPADSRGASLTVPYRLGAPARQPEGSGALSWSRRGASFVLTLPPGSRIDPGAGTISLVLGPSPGQDLRVARTAVTARGPSVAWLPGEAARVTAEDLSKALAGFTDAAYASWSGPRLAAGGWKAPDGAVVFDERIAAGLLAESIPRGTYQGLRPVVAEAAAAQLRAGPAPSLTFSSSAYVGGPREYIRRAAAAGQAEAERVRALLSRSDPSLLETEGLVPALLDHGPFSLATEAASFAGSRDPAQLSPAAALGALEALLDYALLVERTGGAAGTCATLIDSRLLPAIRRADGGLFLQTAAEDTVDVRLSLRCGSLLARAGAEMDIPLAAAVGRSLLVSALALRDEAAALPARLSLADGRIGAREGRLQPESVYALLPVPGRPLAREVPLYGSLGPGAWILTAAEAVSVENTAGSATIALSFPAGLPHYAAVQGIGSVRELRMHGIPWRPAPDYAQYSDGWLYDAQAKTLYLKLTGKTGKEEIQLTW
jgi:hypothetical protein